MDDACLTQGHRNSVPRDKTRQVHKWHKAVATYSDSSGHTEAAVSRQLTNRTNEDTKFGQLSRSKGDGAWKWRQLETLTIMEKMMLLGSSGTGDSKSTAGDYQESVRSSSSLDHSRSRSQRVSPWGIGTLVRETLTYTGEAGQTVRSLLRRRLLMSDVQKRGEGKTKFSVKENGEDQRGWWDAWTKRVRQRRVRQNFLEIRDHADGIWDGTKHLRFECWNV